MKRNLVILFLAMALLPTTKTAAQRHTISGTVINSASHETLIGASVFDNNTKKGATTNEYGFYSLSLPKGEVALESSYVGHEPCAKSFVLRQDTVINILLNEALVVNEVTVWGKRRFQGALSEQMSAVDIPIAQLQSTPTIFGEKDIIKVAQLMPGVMAGTEGSAGMYVRGGGADENLLLLDGVPLYNVNHLLGFFSVFNPDAVKNMTLYKGNFPARFGSRLSSVIDVRTNDGDMYNYHGNVTVGLIASRINVEGPIWRGKTSFNFSARRTYADLFVTPALALLNKQNNSSYGSSKKWTGYYFGDINAKINHKFSDRDRLYLSFYGGDDRVYTRYGYVPNDYSVATESHNSLDWNWGNLTTSLRWNHIISPKLFMESSATFSRYRHLMEQSNSRKENDGMTASTLNVASGIYDWTGRVDFGYTPSPQHAVRFGADYTYHTFVPDFSTRSTQTPTNGGEPVNNVAHSGTAKIYANEVSAYLEDNMELGILKANVGLRYTAFNVQQRWYHSLQPRASLRVLLDSNFSLKAGYSYSTQYIHLLANNNISLPTDLWVPVTGRIAPMNAHQYSLGAYYDIPRLFDISVEAYYKSMDNLLEYRNGESLMATATDWEEKVAMGRGWAYGVEMLLQRTVGKTTGWIGYTWSKSQRLFDREGQELNGGRPFYAKYDRRHDISITLSHRFNDRIDIGATWVYNTGSCTTLATQKYEMAEWGYLANPTTGTFDLGHIEARNNFRLPSYHRLDLGVNLHKQKRHGVRTWSFSLYNAYCRLNPFLISTGGDYDSEGNLTGIHMTKVTLFPIIPSVSYSYKF